VVVRSAGRPWSFPAPQPIPVRRLSDADPKRRRKGAGLRPDPAASGKLRFESPFLVIDLWRSESAFLPVNQQIVILRGWFAIHSTEPRAYTKSERGAETPHRGQSNEFVQSCSFRDADKETFTGRNALSV